jgi:hypothetical protein
VVVVSMVMRMGVIVVVRMSAGFVVQDRRRGGSFAPLPYGEGVAGGDG